jgi:uncharacterized protein
MPSIPRYLRQLEKELAALPGDGEAMLISELDGFLAGVVVCPDPIMPSEWLPLVWGGGDEDAEPAFETIEDAQRLLDLVMRHNNAIAGDLLRGRYAPVFEVDARHDDILWELWIDGFEAAMRLRPESWMKFASADEDTRAALGGLTTLAEVGRRESSLAEAEIRDLTKNAPDLIADWVVTLNTWRTGQHGVSQPETLTPSFGKVGRNEPCPCGSGKKYKKCCGLN